jgi:hypothetical protein
MALSMTYNGVDLSHADYGLRVLRGPHPVTGSPETFTRNTPGRHGGFSGGVGFYEPREMEVTLYVQGTSFSNLQTKLDNVAYAMRPELGNVPIVFDNRSDRRWIGMLNSEISAPLIGNGAIQFPARFMMPYGVSESASLTTQNVTIDESPEALNTASVPGTTHTFPTFLLRNTDSTAITTLSVANSTTGEILTVNYTVPQNHYVRINSNQETIEYSTDGTNFIYIMSARSSTNKAFPRLAPRTVNAITVSGFVAGTLVLTYRGRFFR